jgi:D-xylose transport system ATP-binding protein
MGAGRSELLLHLFCGWGNIQSGQVHLMQRPYQPKSAYQSIHDGMAMVSEDRKGLGLILEQSIGFNLSLSHLKHFVHKGLIKAHLESKANQSFFERLKVKAPHLGSAVSGLSGGNQQKVVLGKALMTEPEVIFLDEPTRGIDVGAKIEVYQLINQLTQAGKAVIMVSSELPELLGMSDRILMLCEGRQTGIFDRQNATQEKLMTAAMETQQPLTI